jgi:Leucine-rich repeat (LRR) protein
VRAEIAVSLGMLSSSYNTSLISSREWNRITDHKTKCNSRTTDANSKRTSLCSRLQNHPAAFDVTGLKLSLVGGNISVIDDVPSALINKVQTLYLSNNHITTLDGIEQFQQLRCLSVANNLIRYVSSLRSLHQNQYLEKISLEGNVVTGMPFYRQYVIGLCPRLLVLDGVNVTVDERNADRSTARQLSAFYDQLRLNELQNIVLRNLFLQLNLHADFSNVVLGKFR